MSAWTFEVRPPVVGPSGAGVTLVDGSCFCISAINGDIDASSPQGLFYRDTRFLSSWRVQVNGSTLEPLGVERSEPFAATFVTRARPTPDRDDSTLLVNRRRFVGNGMREDLVLSNLTSEPSACALSIELDADFAHVFEVKEQHPTRRPAPSAYAADNHLRYLAKWSDGERELFVHGDESAIFSEGRIVIQLVVPPKGQWSTSVQLEVALDGVKAEPHFAVSRPLHHSEPVVRLRSWRQRSPSIASGNDALASIVSTAVEDLGSLRMFDSKVPDRVTVAAGSPWFMTLFGRDSILTSWMTLLVDPSLAAGTMRALAELQGVRDDPLTEEEPGRILHEVRWGAPYSEGIGDVYYGTADATPLFVMLAAELRKWGLGDDWFPAMLEHVDRALRWIDDYGDRDGDGFVEYKRATDRGLLHQGWKDSFDAVTFASGRAAEPPIALCEVQGYVYAAYMGRAQLAAEAGDPLGVEHWTKRASSLKLAFNESFWLPERGWFALALDADKSPVDALASNMGHCLWTGIVDDSKASQVVEHLMSPEMFTGWGIRTLASSMDAFNPVSYHNGSVWPHDTAVVIAGLMRYGFAEEAQRVALGLIEAAVRMGGKLPELFCGFDKAEYGSPVAYPTSCSPQAWSAASIFLVLRALLRFEPAMQTRALSIDPHLPSELGSLNIENVPLGHSRLTIEVGDRGAVHIRGLPPGVRTAPSVGVEYSA